jgi:formylglycine-generating enzyme required for sulfatase activity
LDVLGEGDGMMLTTWMMSALVTMLALGAMAGTPVVSNVRAQQEPGTRYVDISFDLATPGGTLAYVTAIASTNNGTNYTVLLSCPSAQGAIGDNITAGVGKAIRWRPEQSDLTNCLISKAKVRITAIESAGDYLVVDLSAGPEASSYPMSTLTAVPAGGWTDEFKTTKLVLRRMLAGRFAMGSPDDECYRTDNEMQHQVTLTKDFYVGVFEVTQRQWELVMGDRPSYFTNNSCYATRPVEQVSYYDIRENPGVIDDPAVEWPNNSEVNANSFVGKLRIRTGISTFDLPSESQWEYACRAGTRTALNSGYDLTNEYSDAHMAAVGRYSHNGGSGYGYMQGGDSTVGTAKVGSYQPNAWGLYDMHGNVWELCLDWEGTYPGTVTDPKGATSGFGRVVRGGDCVSDAYFCRSACRRGSHPTSRGGGGGFRLARTLP